MAYTLIPLYCWKLTISSLFTEVNTQLVSDLDEAPCPSHDVISIEKAPQSSSTVRLHKPTVSPLLTPVSSRNALLLQSLPTNTPFWQVNARRRKDDIRVGTAARGIVERWSRLPRRFP